MKTSLLLKPCDHCQKLFRQARPLQNVCGPVCANRRVQAAKKEKIAEERASLKKRKEAIKTIPDLIKEADIAFQAWVKARDRAAGYDCISSGRPLEWGTLKTNAGHFRSKGAASACRYMEDNCHAQSSHDNLWLSGNVGPYRARLIERIGLERVEALEAMNATHKWNREELIAIKLKYRQKKRDLEKEREDA